MKSSALMIVFAGVLALSQGSAIQPRRSSLKTVQWSCDLTAIEKLVEELVNDAYGVVFDLRTQVTDAIRTGEDCVYEFLSDPDLKIGTLVSCIKKDVQSTINAVEATVQNFVSEVESTADKIAKQFKICTTL